MLVNTNSLNRVIPAMSGRRFILSIAISPSKIGDKKGHEVTYPIAGKKPKLVKNSREAVSVIKSGESDVSLIDKFPLF
ncbi:unnamed protein product [Onchocerca flexuosa]|uniref:MSP domain-containing protein n=1 Tax=Onchocerca flexuosa TaxID=387005 RepID=A0A183HNT7_9BILA|nr:unnamed protein product [Onchocerca flexuosa]